MRILFLFFLFYSENISSQTKEECQIYSEAFKKIVLGEEFVLYEKEDTQHLKNDFLSESFYYKQYLKSDSLLKQMLFVNFYCVDVKVKSITEKSIDEIWKRKKGWKLFYRKYPKSHGFIRISRIFFNESHSKALFYLSYTRGLLNAAGAYIHMTNNNNKWEIETVEHVWAS